LRMSRRRFRLGVAVTISVEKQIQSVTANQ
jgi:hypothetical protein